MPNALDDLKRLRGPAQLRAEAAAAAARPPPAVFNSHVHLPPNFSAFQTVAQAVELAAAQRCALLGTSNYYDFSAYREFSDRCRAARIFPLFGLEIMCRDEAMAQAGTKVNDPGNPGKIYFCGKGLARFEAPSPRAAAILGELRGKDSARMAEMVRRCCAALAERGVRVDVTPDGIVDALVRRHGCPRETVVLQERHVALGLQEALFAAVPAAARLERLPALLGGPCKLKGPDDAVGLQNEVRNHLMKAGKPGFVPESYIDVATARGLILELGGVPCYPVLADGANPMSEFEARPAELAASLARLGVHAAELIPNRNAPALLVDHVRTLRAAGVVVVAGTEHNTPDLLPILPSAKGAPVPAELWPIFWEGACVLAAHQYLVAHGEPGYVTPEGALQPGHADGEARIAAFAALGAAVIADFQRG